MDVDNGFKGRKASMSLELNSSPVQSLPVTPPDQQFSEENLNAQKQYAQGFLDALRVIQQTNKFEFAASPTQLPLVTTPVDMITPLLTPTNPRDMRAIMMGLLSTPINPPPQATLSSPTALATLGNMTDNLSLHQAALAFDETSTKMLNLAASALPGPPLPPTALLSVAAAVASAVIDPPTSSSVPMSVPNRLPTLASMPSTSRPDKLNLTPPQRQIKDERNDDSDGSDRSRSSSGHGHQLDGMTLDDQERKKLERKRARNRQAASKCRQKKMDRINELEQQVTHEKQRAARLDIELEQLQRTLHELQNLVSTHSSRGCPTTHH